MITLQVLLKDIGNCLARMSQTELIMFAQNWHTLEQYIDQPEANYEAFLKQLNTVIDTYPTLLENAFNRILKEIPRYTPSNFTQPTTTPGLAPVRNEVVQIDEKNRQMINGAASAKA